MRVSLEAECLPLFLIGVLLVLLVELLFTLLVLRKSPETRRPMMGHLVCLFIAFCCLGFLLFGGKAAPDGGAYNRSGLFGLFGLSWFLGECCVIGAVSAALKKANEEI